MNIDDEIEKYVNEFNNEYSEYKIGDLVVNNYVHYKDDNKFRAGVIVKLTPYNNGHFAVIKNKNGIYKIHTDHLKIIRHSRLETKQLESSEDEWTKALEEVEISTRLIRKPTTDDEFSQIFYNNPVQHEKVIHHETIQYIERPRTSIIQKIQNFIDYIRWGRCV